MLSAEQFIKILKQKDYVFDLHKHKPLFTVEDSKQLRGIINGGHSKNLFLKNKKNNFFLLSCEENTTVDLKLFSKSIDAKNLSFAGENYMWEYLGIKPGSVSPYALLNDKKNKVDFYMDEKLIKSDIINFHPLINTITITINTKDFINFIIDNGKKINSFSLENYSIINVL